MTTRNERAPQPQTWVEKDKTIHLTKCGNSETYVEVDHKTGKVTTKTIFRTTKDG